MEITEYEIDLRELFHIIFKKLWLIILVTVIFTGVAAVISYYVLEPVYETHTTLMVSRPVDQESNINYQDILLSQKLVKTYGVIVESRTILQRVINNLDLDMTHEQLSKIVSVTPVKDTEIIKIQVTDTRPVLASAIANQLAVVFMQDVKIIMKVDNVQVIDRATIPERPIKPRPLMNMAVAGVLGMMISIGIILLIEYLDNTIKTENDIQKYLELPIIGAIPEMIE